MDIWQLIMKPAEIIFGIALLYFRFCLYETEEGHLQNFLVDLWIRISDKSDSAGKRFERLLEESARVSGRFFDALFGPKLLSFRALAISAFLLNVSAKVWITFLGPYYDSYRRHDTRDLLFQAGALSFLLLFFLIFLLVTLSPAVARKRWATTLITFVAFVLAIGTLVQFWVVVLVDYLWTVYIRRGTRWALRNGGIWRHILMVMGGAAATVVCFEVISGTEHDGLISRQWLLNHVPSVTPQILFLSDSRLFIAVVSLVQLVVIEFGFLNWIIWPILSRVVYAAERNQFFRERKLFATFGFALLIHAAGGVGWVMTILGLLNKPA
jgi:hypothetical protein